MELPDEVDAVEDAWRQRHTFPVLTIDTLSNKMFGRIETDHDFQVVYGAMANL